MSIRRKIANKLIATFTLVTLLASISGVVSVTIMSSIDSQYSAALSDYGFAQGDIGRALAAFCRMDSDVHDAISYDNEQDKSAAKSEFQAQSQKMDPYLAAVEEGLVSDEARALFQTASGAWKQYLSKANELLTAVNSGNQIQMQQRIVAELEPVYQQFYSAMAALLDDKVDRGDSLSADLSSAAAGGMLMTVVIILISVSVSIIIGVFISRGIAKPLSACSERLERLAKGDLQSEIPTVHSKDETAALAHATRSIVSSLSFIVTDIEHCLDGIGQGNFNVKSGNAEGYVGGFGPILQAMRQIVTQLSHTVEQISQAADQVSEGSDQVSSGAQALSQGATEQASSIQELAATISEISSHVGTSAESAKQASKLAQAVGQHMVESNQEMNMLIAAMDKISERSNEISKIIKTIEDIAFQTNILALNAAVEAARAGTAGKGFAVVADEVRNLANKSSEASKNTSALIEGSIQAVAEGTGLVDRTATTLQKVVQEAEQATEQMNGISQATAEQAEAIQQVTEGIDQISAVVQTNSATAEQSAAASEELSSQAIMLKELVGQFQLRQDT